MKEFLEALTILVPLLIALSPIVVKLFGLLAQLTTSKRLKNLAARAEIIVSALEQSNISNLEKQMEAIDKLVLYANEVGIKLTDQQAKDYIESAYMFLKLLKKDQPAVSQTYLGKSDTRGLSLHNQKGVVIDGNEEVPGERSEFETKEKNIFDKN